MLRKLIKWSVGKIVKDVLLYCTVHSCYLDPVGSNSDTMCTHAVVAFPDDGGLCVVPSARISIENTGTCVVKWSNGKKLAANVIFKGTEEEANEISEGMMSYDELAEYQQLQEDKAVSTLPVPVPNGCLVIANLPAAGKNHSQEPLGKGLVLKPQSKRRRKLVKKQVDPEVGPESQSLMLKAGDKGGSNQERKQTTKTPIKKISKPQGRPKKGSLQKATKDDDDFVIELGSPAESGDEPLDHGDHGDLTLVSPINDVRVQCSDSEGDSMAKDIKNLKSDLLQIRHVVVNEALPLLKSIASSIPGLNSNTTQEISKGSSYPNVISSSESTGNLYPYSSSSHDQEVDQYHFTSPSLSPEQFDLDPQNSSCNSQNLVDFMGNASPPLYQQSSYSTYFDGGSSQLQRPLRWNEHSSTQRSSHFGQPSHLSSNSLNAGVLPQTSQTEDPNWTYPVTEVINPVFLASVRTKSASRPNFAALLVRSFFNREVRMTSNVSGKCGKNQLDKESMAAIKMATFKMWPCVATESEKEAWQRCVKAIDESGRRLYRPKTSGKEN